MRRLFLCMTLAASLGCGISSTAMAAEHIVQRGDTLTQIARSTHFTVKQLAAMNDGIKNPNRLLVGYRIVYYNHADIADAISWCKKRMQELPPSDGNYQIFADTVDDLNASQIRYSIFEPTGTHFSNIFVYAHAWREHGAHS